MNSDDYRALHILQQYGPIGAGLLASLLWPGGRTSALPTGPQEPDTFDQDLAFDNLLLKLQQRGLVESLPSVTVGPEPCPPCEWPVNNLRWSLTDRGRSLLRSRQATTGAMMAGILMATSGLTLEDVLRKVEDEDE